MDALGSLVGGAASGTVVVGGGTSLDLGGSPPPHALTPTLASVSHTIRRAIPSNCSSVIEVV